IGVQDQRRDLRPHPIDYALQQRPAAERPKRLVAAAHPPALAAGEQQPEDVHPPSPSAATSSARLALRARRAGSSPMTRGSLSKPMRSSPAPATKRLPLARPIRVTPACPAGSAPQAVKPERDIRIGMHDCAAQ